MATSNLKALPCCKALYGAANTVTRTFPMTGGEEVPLCFHTVVLSVVGKVEETFAVFILCGTAITKIEDLIHGAMRRLQEFNKSGLKQVYSDDVVRVAVGNCHETFVMDNSILSEIYHEWMEGRVACALFQ